MSECVDICLRFWGVRGSIPSPGVKTSKYGGNTSCLEMRIGQEERLIIIDAGSGIRELGNYLLRHDLPKGSIDADLFLTHTHWDHITGFPFFTPIYIPGTTLRVYGPVSFESESLEEIVGGQMKYRYFPVNAGELRSTISYEWLQQPEIELGGGLLLRTRLLNHPLIALGYRFEYAGKTICTCYDTEPYYNLFVSDPQDPAYDEAMAEEGERAAQEMNAGLEDFFRGADILVHDAQYTDEEYQKQYRTWGHSPMEPVIASALRGGVKRLALFHHDPDRTDDELDRLEQRFRSQCGDELDVFFAREGMTLTL